MNSVRFEDPYDHIGPMYNTHKGTHLIDTQEPDIDDAEVEIEELFEDKNYNFITEEKL